MSTYLAAEDYAMDRRSRGLHRFLVSSPVVLLIAISAVGHLRKPAHVGAAGTAEYDRRVLAYRDRVVAVEQLTFVKGTGNLDSLEREAKSWADGYRSGELMPLKPAAYEDHLRDSVRGEVLNAGLVLGSQLSAGAKHALERGNYSQAVSTSLLAAETVLGMRQFELEAYLQCVHSARRPLDTVEQAWPHLSAAERQALRPRLTALRVDPQEPTPLAELDEGLVRDYVARQGQPDTMRKLSPFALGRDSAKRREAAQKSATVHNSLLRNLLDPEQPRLAQP